MELEEIAKIAESAKIGNWKSKPLTTEDTENTKEGSPLINTDATDWNREIARHRLTEGKSSPRRRGGAEKRTNLPLIYADGRRYGKAYH